MSDQSTPPPGFWQETITIGKHSYPRFMAAPLDGVTDSPLRRLIREFSPNEQLLFTEMRHVACVVHEKDNKSLRYEPIEQPLCYQVSANKTDFIDEAVEKIVAAGFIMLNLNLGCPARCVTRSGGGSALMANIPLLRQIMAKLQRATEGKIPLTVKLRAGFKEKNAYEVAQVVQEYGVAAIAIHPRTAPERFTSRLDFDLVRRVKEVSTVPIIFSGNVNNFSRAKKTYELTGVDGFMIGRALWGAPWKIHEITEEAAGRNFSLSMAKTIRYALKHLSINFDFYGYRVGMNMFKKQLAQYVRGINNAAHHRRELLLLQSGDEMREKLEQLLVDHS